MTSKLNSSKTVAAVAAAALCALSGVAQAQDKPLEIKISGQVNRVVFYADDGDQHTVFNTDNVNSSTRIRFVGEKEFMPGISAGVNWEVEYRSQPSSSVAFGNRSGGQGTGSPTFGERWGEVFFKSKQFGKLSLGQGDGAANGNTEIDLSGTAVIQYSDPTVVGGGFKFRDKNKAGPAAGPTISATTSNFDFEGRFDRVRYDTPALGPVVLSASYGNRGEDSVFDFGGRLAMKVPGGEIAGAVGWEELKNNATLGDAKYFNGSLSFLSTTGFNATVAIANKSDDVNTIKTGLNANSKSGKFYYGKLGYKMGIHAVSVDVGRGKDQALNGDKSTVVGVAYVMTPASWIELFAQAKQYDLNHGAARASTVSYDQLTFVGVGSRIKF